MSNKKENICYGCTACMAACPNHAISMKMNSKGFYTANVNEMNCNNCGACLQVCPVFRKLQSENPACTVYALQIKDKIKRLESQSGGAYRIFAEAVLQRGGVLYGVAMKDGRASYERIEAIGEEKRLSGSKYVQAFLGNALLQVKEDLISGKEVLFSGTPCYIDGLKNYLNCVQVETEKLFTIDLICHGTPSPGVFQQYINVLSEEYKAVVTEFNFRDKVFGWGSHICSFKKENKKLFSENFVKIFYSHLCLNESCYVCSYANTKRNSDITIGDCWGIRKICPELEDLVGTSMLMLNTEKGCCLFEEVKYKALFQRITVDYAYQPNLCLPTEKPVNYDDFWSSYHKKGFLDTVNKYCGYQIDESSLTEKLGWKLYQKVLSYLEEKKVHSIFLYGIGITMWQMICYIENEQKDISISGLLDYDKTYNGKTFMGYYVFDECDLPKENYVVFICSRNKQSVEDIKRRLYSNSSYKNAKLCHLFVNTINEG